MLTSSNGNIFRVTGSLCGKSTGRWWIPLTKAIDVELWCFLRSAPEQTLGSKQAIETPAKWDAIALIMTSPWNPQMEYHWDHFYLHGSTLIPAWISHYIQYNVWGEILVHFQNWAWISKFIPHFTRHVITYLCWDKSQSMWVQWAPEP